MSAGRGLAVWHLSPRPPCHSPLAPHCLPEITISLLAARHYISFTSCSSLRSSPARPADLCPGPGYRPNQGRGEKVRTPQSLSLSSPDKPDGPHFRRRPFLPDLPFNHHPPPPLFTHPTSFTPTMSHPYSRPHSYSDPSRPSYAHLDHQHASPGGEVRLVRPTSMGSEVDMTRSSPPRDRGGNLTFGSACTRCRSSKTKVSPRCEIAVRCVSCLAPVVCGGVRADIPFRFPVHVSSSV